MRTHLLIVILLALPAAVSAQTIPNVEMTLRENVGDQTVSWADMSQQTLAEFFNDAHCRCGTTFGIRFRLASTTTSNEELEVWFGRNCTDLVNVTERDMRCVNPHVFSDVGQDLRSEPTVAFNAADLMWPNVSCGSDEFAQTIWALVNAGGGTTYSQDWETQVDVDTEAPPLPDEVTAVGAEDAVVVRWKPPASDAQEIRWYQIMCASSLTGEPLFPTPPADPEYQTMATECPQVTPPDPDAGPTPDAAPTPDAGPPADADPTPDAGMPIGSAGSLDPRFVCGGAVSGSSTSARINLASVDLDPSESVVVWVVSIDEHRNPNVVIADPSGGVRPAPVTDFWESYEDNGGDAAGGFCSVAAGAIRGLSTWLLLLGAAAFLLVWVRARKRRRTRDEHGSDGNKPRRPGAGAAGPLIVLIVLGMSSRVWAQSIVYEDDAEVVQEIVLSDWNFELKFGPYMPDVDGEPGLMQICTMPDANTTVCKGPYERMFGGASLMTMLELDRFFLWKTGQLGVAGAIGFMQDSARAFAQNPDGSTNYNMRAEGDETSFHLLPMSLSVVYRFTELADRTYVPLVPYGKVGLSYYLWWTTKGDGSVSRTDTGGKGRGGTLGWQATVGVSVRADRFDLHASRNLQTEYGVEHAGFFFEAMWANVSGLGADKKLRVGDATWFAGINFEF